MRPVCIYKTLQTVSQLRLRDYNISQPICTVHILYGPICARDSTFRGLYAYSGISFKIFLLISQLIGTFIQISMSAIKFKKALTISICLISKLNRVVMVTASFYIIFLYTPTNIQLKSFPCYYLNPLITYLAFCFRILPSLSLLVFKISLPSSTLMPFSSFNCFRSF